MFLVIMGSVDICNNIFIKQFLTEVTYQGALEGTISSVSETEVIDSVRSHLEARGIENAAISVQGVESTSYDLVEPGEMSKWWSGFLQVTGLLHPSLFRISVWTHEPWPLSNNQLYGFTTRILLTQ